MLDITADMTEEIVRKEYVRMLNLANKLQKKINKYDDAVMELCDEFGTNPVWTNENDMQEIDVVATVQDVLGQFKRGYRA